MPKEKAKIAINSAVDIVNVPAVNPIVVTPRETPPVNGARVMPAIAAVIP